ncbi:syncoilin-like isoform X2 [Oncorhynchus nerka]|uniref:syncoilin-like isoform X2 n=1 Tax=Oncorhynchus nerka TaxID=8023 RepID=UPI0011323505|nr:syncoilin-like isoform X2 [Oncorhynchus nerka]
MFMFRQAAPQKRWSKEETVCLCCYLHFSASLSRKQVMETPMAVEDLQRRRKVESRENLHSGEDSMEEAHSVESSLMAALTHHERSMYGAGFAAQAHITEVVSPVERCVEYTFVQVQVNMDSVGLLFEECIKKVGHLESQRDELILELLQLEQPMLQATVALRGQLLEARRVLTSVQLEFIHLQIEVGQVKSKLFVTARDCIQSQLALAAQQYEVAQAAITQEEHRAHIQNLTEEVAQLQEAQHNQLNTLKDRARQPSRPRAMSDVTHCRRASLDLQKRLSGSMRNLEGWYEPRLLALLRRRQAGKETLRRSRDVGRDLKARLGPLKEQTQRLELQRACLEERIALMERERVERVAQYKETVNSLEETMRKLKLELCIQKKANRQLEELKKGLLRAVLK